MPRRQLNLPVSTPPPASRVPGRAPTPTRFAGRESGRAGFTLVEMMVAVMILAIGLLGLASTASYVVRQMGGGARQTIAANVLQSRMEWLRSIPCDSIKNTTTVTRGVREHWVPGATSNKVLSVVDTVQYSFAGSRKTQTTQAYTMMVPCW